MNIAFGHSSADLDSMGSLLLIKKLYPDYQLVKSRLLQPTALNLYNFYPECFNCINPKDLSGEKIDNIIIVDTRVAARVKEYFQYIRQSDPEIRIFDHHEGSVCDILGAELIEAQCGANTSFLVKLAMERGISFSPEEATIALTGIYADTGKLIYENVRREDFEASAYLLDMGASLRLVRSFLETIKEDDQLQVMQRLLANLEPRIIQGHSVLFTYLELEENVSGLSEVVEKIMEMQNPDAYFAIFSIPKTGTVLLIARSQRDAIDLHDLIQTYGGGGHHKAASAKIDNTQGPAFREALLQHLETSLAPALRAKDIMSRNVKAVQHTMSLMEASLFLEEVNFSGAPVVDDKNGVIGFISLKEISKGRKANSMKAPVTAYMTKPAIVSHGMITMREVERIFYKHHIGHLPIVEDEKLVGILTRGDYLEYTKGLREEIRKA